MGEGILIHGLGDVKYTKKLRVFISKVISRERPNNSLFDFGLVSKTVLRYANENGVDFHSKHVVITDKVVRKYLNHPKENKGAVVNFHRFRMVASAVKHPKNVYLDTNRNRLVFASTVKYDTNRVIKVVLEPNQKIGKKRYFSVVSIGVVNRVNMRDAHYKKIK